MFAFLALLLHTCYSNPVAWSPNHYQGTPEPSFNISALGRAPTNDFPMATLWRAAFYPDNQIPTFSGVRFALVPIWTPPPQGLYSFDIYTRGERWVYGGWDRFLSSWGECSFRHPADSIIPGAPALSPNGTLVFAVIWKLDGSYLSVHDADSGVRLSETQFNWGLDAAPACRRRSPHVVDSPNGGFEVVIEACVGSDASAEVLWSLNVDDSGTVVTPLFSRQRGTIESLRYELVESTFGAVVSPGGIIYTIRGSSNSSVCTLSFDTSCVISTNKYSCTPYSQYLVGIRASDGVVQVEQPTVFNKTYTHLTLSSTGNRLFVIETDQADYEYWDYEFLNSESSCSNILATGSGQPSLNNFMEFGTVPGKFLAAYDVSDLTKVWESEAEQFALDYNLGNPMYWAQHSDVSPVTTLAAPYSNCGMDLIFSMLVSPDHFYVAAVTYDGSSHWVSGQLGTCGHGNTATCEGGRAIDNNLNPLYMWKAVGLVSFVPDTSLSSPPQVLAVIPAYTSGGSDPLSTPHGQRRNREGLVAMNAWTGEILWQNNFVVEMPLAIVPGGFLFVWSPQNRPSVGYYGFMGCEPSLLNDRRQCLDCAGTDVRLGPAPFVIAEFPDAPDEVYVTNLPSCEPPNPISETPGGVDPGGDYPDNLAYVQSHLQTSQNAPHWMPWGGQQLDNRGMFCSLDQLEPPPVRWTFDPTRKVSIGKSPPAKIAGPPTIGKDGTVYQGVKAAPELARESTIKVYALNPEDGSIKWVSSLFSDNDWINGKDGSRMSFVTPIQISPSGDRLIVGWTCRWENEFSLQFIETQVSFLDIKDGALLSSIAAFGDDGIAFVHVGLSESADLRIAVQVQENAEGQGYQFSADTAGNGKLYMFDSSGIQMWMRQFDNNGPWAFSCLGDQIIGSVYYASWNGEVLASFDLSRNMWPTFLVALDVETGLVDYEYHNQPANPTETYIKYGPPSISCNVDGTYDLFAASSDNEIINLDETGGSPSPPESIDAQIWDTSGPGIALTKPSLLKKAVRVSRSSPTLDRDVNQFATFYLEIKYEGQGAPPLEFVAGSKPEDFSFELSMPLPNPVYAAGEGNAGTFLYFENEAIIALTTEGSAIWSLYDENQGYGMEDQSSVWVRFMVLGAGNTLIRSVPGLTTLGGGNSNRYPAIEYRACPVGSGGPLCSICEPGYYYFDGICRKCPDVELGPLTLALMIGIFIIAIILLMLLGASPASGAISIALNFCQVLGLLKNVGIVFHPTVELGFSIVALANLDFDMAAPQCFVPGASYQIRFYFQTAVPALLIFIMLIVYRAIRDKAPKAATGLMRLTLWTTMVGFLSVTRKSLSVFSCTSHLDGSETLNAYPIIHCFGDPEANPEWWSLVPAAVIGLLFFSTSTVLITLWATGKVRKAVEGKTRLDDWFVSRYSVVFKRYRNGANNYEVSVLLRKAYAAAISLLFLGDEILIVSSIIMVASMAALGAAYLRPFKDHIDNFLEISLNLILVAVTALALSSAPSDNFAEDEDQEIKNTLAEICLIVLAVAGGIILFAVIIRTLVSVINRKKQKQQVAAVEEAALERIKEMAEKKGKGEQTARIRRHAKATAMLDMMREKQTVPIRQERGRFGVCGVKGQPKLVAIVGFLWLLGCIAAIAGLYWVIFFASREPGAIRDGECKTESDCDREEPEYAMPARIFGGFGLVSMLPPIPNLSGGLLRRWAAGHKYVPGVGGFLRAIGYVGQYCVLLSGMPLLIQMPEKPELWRKQDLQDWFDQWFIWCCALFGVQLLWCLDWGLSQFQVFVFYKKITREYQPSSSSSSSDGEISKGTELSTALSGDLVKPARVMRQGGVRVAPEVEAGKSSSESSDSSDSSSEDSMSRKSSVRGEAKLRGDES